MEGYFETVFLIYENTKPNIEVSGLLYQKKTANHLHCLLRKNTLCMVQFGIMRDKMSSILIFNFNMLKARFRMNKTCPYCLKSVNFSHLRSIRPLESQN